jgi:DNA polymerase-1
MIVLIDLGHLFWLHYYATRSNVDAYTLTIDKIREHHENSERLAVCCDGPPLKRAEMYPEYKANRDPKPEEALDSLRSVEQQVASWGVPVVRIVGYEADDLIAALATQAINEGVRIISNDKDLYSLIREDVFMVRKDGTLIDVAETVKKFGVKPSQMTDYLTLVGDTADNIPGCPGVGPGRASDLLVEFTTLEAIMKATDGELLAVRGVGKKTLDGLRGWDPALALSLVTLDIGAPVKLSELWPERHSEPPPEPAHDFSIQW